SVASRRGVTRARAGWGQPCEKPAQGWWSVTIVSTPTRASASIRARSPTAQSQVTTSPAPCLAPPANTFELSPCDPATASGAGREAARGQQARQQGVRAEVAQFVRDRRGRRLAPGRLGWREDRHARERKAGRASDQETEH